MKIVRPKNKELTVKQLCYGDIFEYQGDIFMHIKLTLALKDSLPSLDEYCLYKGLSRVRDLKCFCRGVNAVSLEDGNLVMISEDAIVKRFDNAKMVLEPNKDEDDEDEDFC